MKILQLQLQYEGIATRYREKCKLNEGLNEAELLLVKQGAALAEGTISPATAMLVDVVRSLQKQATDDICERATEYTDLARAIADILEGGTSTGR